MTTRIINRRDLEFILFEVLDSEALTAWPRFAETHVPGDAERMVLRKTP